MSSPNHSLETKNSGAVIVVDFAESPGTREYRQTISRVAWEALTDNERTSMQKVAHKVAGDDSELVAAYSQALLVINYVNQRANIHTDPTVLLPEDSYRFWY